MVSEDRVRFEETQCGVAAVAEKPANAPSVVAVVDMQSSPTPCVFLFNHADFAPAFLLFVYFFVVAERYSIATLVELIAHTPMSGFVRLLGPAPDATDGGLDPLAVDAPVNAAGRALDNRAFT
jgi:hypothetical protein